ncbi:MAG: undecaprenyl/decaprenyl-phosphate alpha-N-acetylglucosaminyl 1-phosphate transferase [Candidatus Tectomicrobia bacterium]|nr:undecaprenyl/decaprenyl-phosphate alpha-N-acetylglucosaminyl 1-phosphate transferase [Candidatus Tectomicrobia bacterium]
MTDNAEQTEDSGFSYAYLYGAAFIILGFILMPQVRGWMKDHGHRWLYVPAVSLLASFLITPIVRALALRLKVVDVPDAHKIHGWDDMRRVRATVKMAAQLLACAIVVYSGVRLSFFPPGLLEDAVEIFLTFLWLIGISNALNFLDGMDGLASGLGAIASLFIGITALQTDQPFLMFLSLGLMGGCLGFLPYNLRGRKPAAIFLGDAGSTFIGFTLASLGVLGIWDVNDPIKAFAMPMLILGVLIFDTTFITVSRVISGKVSSVREWLEYVGRDHIHHKLVDVGLSRRQTVFFIFLVAASLGISALVLRNGRTVDALLLLIQGFNILFLLVILMQKGAGTRNKDNGSPH